MPMPTPMPMPMPQLDAVVQPAYSLIHAEVMTDEQLETLRRQISVYATISQQLVEMHKAIMAQQGVIPGFTFGQSISFDPAFPSAGQKLTSRQRWTPSQTQLQILEKLFEKGSGTPNKQRIKEITQDLSQHGQISETNVYNWFQNRRARTKRKQQLGGFNNGESEIETEVDSPEEKGAKMEKDMPNESFGAGHTDMKLQTCDSPEHYQFNTQKGIQSSQMHERVDKYGVSFNRGLAGVDLLVDCKPWGLSAFMLNIKANTAGNSVSQECPGEMVMSNGAGKSLKLLQNGENYSHVE